MLLLYSVNTQSFVYDKLSSIYQWLITKFQKLLRYLHGTVISTFKAVTSGRSGHSGCAD